MTEVKGSLAFSYDFTTQTFSVVRISSGAEIESELIPEMTVGGWTENVNRYDRIYNQY